MAVKKKIPVVNEKKVYELTEEGLKEELRSCGSLIRKVDNIVNHKNMKAKDKVDEIKIILKDNGYL